MAAAESPDPRRRVEDAMRRVAMAMRPSPTLPPDIEDPSVPCPDADKAVPLPQKHCAFAGCVLPPAVTNDTTRTSGTKHPRQSFGNAINQLMK